MLKLLNSSKLVTQAHTNAVTMVGVDLRHCSMLKGLGLWLDSELTTDGKSLDMFKTMLSSWKFKASSQYIFMTPYAPHRFTRKAFADLLSAVGNIVEECLGDAGSWQDMHENGGDGGGWLGVQLFDQGGWQDWWRKHIDNCFPTFVRHKKLNTTFTTRKQPLLNKNTMQSQCS